MSFQDKENLKNDPAILEQELALLKQLHLCVVVQTSRPDPVSQALALASADCRCNHHTADRHTSTIVIR
jgi:hypothetical protein